MLKHYIRFSQVLFERLPTSLQDQNSGILKVFQGVLGAAEFFEPVILFFVVSGFLTAASMERSGRKSAAEPGTDIPAYKPGQNTAALRTGVSERGDRIRRNVQETEKQTSRGNAFVFLKKRFFRIYPELWLSGLVYFAVLLIMVPGLLDRSMLKWAIAQFLGIAYTPACLKGYATGSINGVLWMIFVLVQMYVLLAVFGNKLKSLRPAGWGIVLAICTVCNLVCRAATATAAAAAAGNVFSTAASEGSLMPPFSVSIASFLHSHHGIISKIIERLFLPYALWYLIGVFCFVFKDAILPFCRKYGWVCLGGIIVIQAAAGRWIPGIWSYGYYCGIGEGLCTAAAAILAAFSLPALRVRKDVTYEIYLYHWLFLNVWVGYDLIWNGYPALMLVGFLCASVAMAYVMKLVYTRCVAKFDLGNVLGEQFSGSK